MSSGYEADRLWSLAGRRGGWRRKFVGNGRSGRTHGAQNSSYSRPASSLSFRGKVSCLFVLLMLESISRSTAAAGSASVPKVTSSAVSVRRLICCYCYWRMVWLVWLVIAVCYCCWFWRKSMLWELDPSWHAESLTGGLNLSYVSELEPEIILSSSSPFQKSLDTSFIQNKSFTDCYNRASLACLLL